ncbi:unnamed protein product [Arabis nemorensis]|uniref:Uncharacterized protein n=1 Tax=Arabis nemorensis TaxID=586526 RepID=A0A565B787_9BRAS|nr:unnamed protein product [Arabis nemorensis]
MIEPEKGGSNILSEENKENQSMAFQSGNGKRILGKSGGNIGGDTMQGKKGAKWNQEGIGPD